MGLSYLSGACPWAAHPISFAFRRIRWLLLTLGIFRTVPACGKIRPITQGPRGQSVALGGTETGIPHPHFDLALRIERWFPLLGEPCPPRQGVTATRKPPTFPCARSGETRPGVMGHQETLQPVFKEVFCFHPLAHGIVGPSARPTWAYQHPTWLTGILSHAVRPISHEGVRHNVSESLTSSRGRRSAPPPTVSRSLRMNNLYKMPFGMSI